MANKKLLITGAAGYIASQILPTFQEAYELVLIDTTDKDWNGEKIEGITIVDLMNPDRKQYSRYFEDVDAVIHLAYKRGGYALDDFLVEKANVEMAYNIFRTAFEVGTQRVVMASSNHAADWYERDMIHDRKMDILDPYTIPLSDNFYGWSKASYEHMGFVFASGKFGRKLEVVMVRIGAPAEINLTSYKDNIRSYKRDLGAYISKRDISQLFIRSIQTPNINNLQGIPWQIVYGISGNTRSFWSITNARQVLGYKPQDDSEVKYSKDIQTMLTGENAKESVGRVGE